MTIIFKLHRFIFIFKSLPNIKLHQLMTIADYGEFVLFAI